MFGSAISGSGAPSSAAAQWKSLTSATGTASSAAPAGVFKSVGAKGDSVSVSPLGDALSGIASDVFNALDPKARKSLESIVSSGRMSAEEVVKGLQSMATKAVFNRYVQERPQDEDDKRRLAASEAHSQAIRSMGDTMGAARAKNAQSMDALMAAQERGEISVEEMHAQLKPLTEEFQAQIASAQAVVAGYDPTDLSAGFTKNVNGFKEAMKSMTGGDGFVEFGDADANAAEQKLQEAGFTGAVFGDAFKTVAKSVDIPGIGRAAGAPPLESEIKAKIQAGQMAATQTQTTVTATTTTTSVLTSALQAREEQEKNKNAAGPDDPGFSAVNSASSPDLAKSQAALSVLKAAMEAKSNKAKGITVNQTDQNATIILDMLKAIDGPKTQTATPDNVFTTGTNQVV